LGRKTREGGETSHLISIYLNVDISKAVEIQGHRYWCQSKGIYDFLLVINSNCTIPAVVQLLLMTNIGSRICLSIDTNIDDLGWPWTTWQILLGFCEISQIWETTTAKRMKYCQRRNCSPFKYIAVYVKRCIDYDWCSKAFLCVKQR